MERHGTPRNRPTRTGRQQQGRAPNQDKRRLGARPAAAAVAGPGDEGATLYWLVIVNERMRWLGWGREADAGLQMVLGIGCAWGAVRGGGVDMPLIDVGVSVRGVGSVCVVWHRGSLVAIVADIMFFDELSTYRQCRRAIP